MAGRRHVVFGIGPLTIALLAVAGLPASEDAGASGTVRIGLVRSLFRDLPESMVQVLMQPFGSLMRAQTGMNGEILFSPDALDLGRCLDEGKMDLGVFHGFEFAWAQQKYPDLRPLVIAINKHRHLNANLVVRSDCDAASLADLKGKVVGLPRLGREHCRLFLERQCLACGAEPRNFFAKVVVPRNVEDGLDDVVRGKLQAVVVDNLALECYAQVKSGCFARLKVLKRSEIFPAAVVAYRQGAIDDAKLARFRDGMVGAVQNERSRDLLTLWKLTAFEDVPADFPQTLANIARAYPYVSTPPTVPVASPVPSE
jgi:ABC-type phosphate/phosphonate transport system substrate-binding protein